MQLKGKGDVKNDTITPSSLLSFKWCPAGIRHQSIIPSLGAVHTHTYTHSHVYKWMTLPGFPQHLINSVQAASVVQKGKANENTHSDQLHRYATNYCERTALQKRLTGPAPKQTSPARSESKQDISITVMSVIFSCSTRMGKTSARLSVCITLQQALSVRKLPPFLSSLQTPSFNRVRPEKGPVSGGTRLTISGRHLDAGSAVTVLLAQEECLFVR